MEIKSFILGVCAGIVVMMVVGTVVNYMTTMSLKKEINSIQNNCEHIQRELDKKEHEIWNGLNNIDRNLRDEMEKIYRHTDSRVDKTVDGVSKQISEIYRELDKLKTEKSVING